MFREIIFITHIVMTGSRFLFDKVIYTALQIRTFPDQADKTGLFGSLLASQ